MRPNTLKSMSGARKTRERVGRGGGSKGKTCGRGHKGQRSRSGRGGLAIGFEGGQMPLQLRLPKFGFTSRRGAFVAELRLHELNAFLVEGEVTPVDLAALKEKNLVPQLTRSVKVIVSGEVKGAVRLQGLRVTKGAKQAIEAAGGEVV